jgi:serine/threonine protein kinase
MFPDSSKSESASCIYTPHYLKHNRGDEYARLLQSQKLWPVDPLFEQNWSGRGQHAEFKKHEQKLIDEILEVQENLGTTRTAFVQSVKCRRILLARKTIICGKQTMTKKEAIAEVSHLTQLNHAHILRIIGTYVKGRELSILLYPVADCNLENFLGIYHNNFRIPTGVTPEVGFLVDCFGCLSSAVRYIHRNLTKHMDIKPQNILVQKSPVAYTLFIADFGIARSYAKLEETETDGATSFTKRYAAPEVVKQEYQGLPADIFSLGCVFLEVYDALYWPWNREQNISGLQACLDANPSGDTSYQANIDTLQAEVWRFATLDWRGGPRPSLIVKMLNHHPLDRPTAETLVFALGERHCCSGGSIALQALANDHSDSEKPDI